MGLRGRKKHEGWVESREKERKVIIVKVEERRYRGNGGIFGREISLKSNKYY